MKATAVVPNEIPELPKGAQGWVRSTRRGSVFHAHSLGRALCGSTVNLDRHKSEGPNSAADMKYWGVCPRCFAKSKAEAL